jgi:hypothetical protein
MKRLPSHLMTAAAIASKGGGQSKAERGGCLDADDKIELGRLLNGISPAFSRMTNQDPSDQARQREYARPSRPH